jgi:Ca2+-binding RTX toxin-like protein
MPSDSAVTRLSLLRKALVLTTDRKLASDRFQSVQSEIGWVSRQTGTGFLAVATVLTALSDELQAGILDHAFLDDGTLALKDFRFGIVQVFTKDAIPRVFFIDDPEFDLLIERIGSGFNVESVKNSVGRMAELFGHSQETFAILRMGQSPLSSKEFLGSGGLLNDASIGVSNSLQSFTQAPALLPAINASAITNPQSDIALVSLSPKATVTISAIADDTGRSATDFVTSDTMLTVSGSNGALAPGERIQLSSDGGLTWHDVTQTSATTWSYDDTATSHSTSFTYTARIIDAAGNVGTSTTQDVIIDTTAPTEALTITAIADDTGRSAADFVTSDTTLVVSGSNGALAPGETIQLSSDNGFTWHDVTATSASTWSYDDAAINHTISFSYTARIVDAAGNVGTSTSQDVIIDTSSDPNDNDSFATGTDPNGTFIDSTVIGTPGDDTINGANSDQTIYGGAGDDTLNGGNSMDLVYGGSGNDHIVANNGGDQLYGGSGNDTIEGGQSKDLLVGGHGADVLIGGNGADIFQYLSPLDSPAQAGEFDTITDFTSVLDILDFSEIGGITTLQGAATGSTVDAHSIAWVINPDGSVDVYVNTTGSAATIGAIDSSAPDMQVHLDNVTSLVTTDFLI